MRKLYKDEFLDESKKSNITIIELRYTLTQNEYDSTKKRFLFWTYYKEGEITATYDVIDKIFVTEKGVAVKYTKNGRIGSTQELYNISNSTFEATVNAIIHTYDYITNPPSRDKNIKRTNISLTIKEDDVISYNMKAREECEKLAKSYLLKKEISE